MWDLHDRWSSQKFPFLVVPRKSAAGEIHHIPMLVISSNAVREKMQSQGPICCIPLLPFLGNYYCGSCGYMVFLCICGIFYIYCLLFTESMVYTNVGVPRAIRWSFIAQPLRSFEFWRAARADRQGMAHVFDTNRCRNWMSLCHWCLCSARLFFCASVATSASKCMNLIHVWCFLLAAQRFGCSISKTPMSGCHSQHQAHESVDCDLTRILQWSWLQNGLFRSNSLTKKKPEQESVLGGSSQLASGI